MEVNNIIAPFVLKTYQMVNDSTTDELISWGEANNSFIVIDPLIFSHRMLPAYFKHNNFSSFVRQLNTYGFKKVDPDRWEFGNEWFLRGQKHLLMKINRKKQSNRSNMYQNQGISHENLDLDDEEMVMEIAALKEEQKALEEEFKGMNKRLEATERRPHQMMTFLHKVVEDPELFPRMMLEKAREMKISEKKRRLTMPPPSSSSSATSSSSSSGMVATTSIKSEEEGIMSSLSPEISSPGWVNQRQYMVQPFAYAAIPVINPLTSLSGSGIGNVTAVPESEISGYGSISQLKYFGELAAEASPPPPYPFSLFGGGF